MKHITIFIDVYTGERTYGFPDVSETICKECKNYEKLCKKEWRTFETFPEAPDECDDYVYIKDDEDE